MLTVTMAGCQGVNMQGFEKQISKLISGSVDVAFIPESITTAGSEHRRAGKAAKKHTVAQCFHIAESSNKEGPAIRARRKAADKSLQLSSVVAQEEVLNYGKSSLLCHQV